MHEYNNILKFTIDGDVQAQQRPRFARRGNHVSTYDPIKSTTYKQKVASVASNYSLDELIVEPIRLTLDIHIKIPKSYTKKKIKQIENGELLYIKKPDVDNLAKGIKDGITGVLWKDDSLIVELIVRKHYSINPRAEVVIEW